MPLWTIYHPPSTFSSAASKAALVHDITTIYTSAGLPPFYVVVNFITLSPSQTFVGGQLATERSTAPFIRFVIDHLAIHSEDHSRLKAAEGKGLTVEEVNRRIAGRIDAALKSHVEDKGYEWEYHVIEAPRSLWKINGIAPPPWRSEGEEYWRKMGRAVAWEDGEREKL
jgi:phenylpyruvate tautomerase PptA (4-oxalocrotonate tautomerase family)